jgi:membrane protease YdiL (CAAX protease family)
MIILLMFVPVPDPSIWGQEGPSNILAGVAQLIGGAGVAVGMHFISKPLFQKLFIDFKVSTFTSALKFALIAYACAVCAKMVDLTLFGPTMENANQQAIESLMMDSPVVGVLMAVVLAPVIEELIFRYYVFKGLEKRNIYLAYAVSSLGFVAIHLIASIGTPFFLQDLRSIPVYAVGGIVFCYAYHKTKNIGVNIGAHMIYNAIATILVFVSSLSGAVAPAVEIVDVKQTQTSLTITIDENEDMMVNVKTMEIHLYDTYNPNVDYNMAPGLDRVTMNGDVVVFDNLKANTHYIIIINYDMNNPEYGEVGEAKSYIDLYTLR